MYKINGRPNLLNMIKNLQDALKYCDKNKRTVNIDKTKVLAFPGGGGGGEKTSSVQVWSNKY